MSRDKELLPWKVCGPAARLAAGRRLASSALLVGVLWSNLRP